MVSIRAVLGSTGLCLSPSPWFLKDRPVHVHSVEAASFCCASEHSRAARLGNGRVFVAAVLPFLEPMKMAVGVAKVGKWGYRNAAT